MPHALDAGTVRRLLDLRPVAVLPGFVGRDVDGRHTLLGRGGADLTALFAAHALGAERCRLLKDVDGIYEHDPAVRGRRRPRRYTALDWQGALRLDDCILQRKATQFAYRHRVCFEVGRAGSEKGTLVGAAESRLARPRRSGRPRRARPARLACAALAVEGGSAS
jgi:homoserine dehydrogenase